MIKLFYFNLLQQKSHHYRAYIDSSLSSVYRNLYLVLCRVVLQFMAGTSMCMNYSNYMTHNYESRKNHDYSICRFYMKYFCESMLNSFWQCCIRRCFLRYRMNNRLTRCVWRWLCLQSVSFNRLFSGFCIVLKT